MFKKYSKRTRIYLFVTLTIFFVIIALGIISPIVSNNKLKNWDRILIDKTDYIENTFNQTLDKKSAHLIRIDAALKYGLRKKINRYNTNFKGIFDFLFSPPYNKYSIQLYDSENRIFAWNAEPVLFEKDLNNIDSTLGQTFFSGQKLVTYLSLIDTLNLDSTRFKVICSIPVEKHYSFSAGKDNNANLADSLSGELGTALKIDFSPSAERSRDGRKYSFAILNNYKNKIGMVTVDKPSLDVEVNYYGNLFRDVQNILIIFIYLLPGLWLAYFIKRLKLRSLKFLIAALYLLTLRILLFVLGVPSGFLNNSLTDASNFSSVFAFGMVRSPLELSVSVITIFIIAYVGFKNSINWFNGSSANGKIIQKAIAVIFLPLFYLLMLRGLGASLRSVVFDSTIRYFKVFSLFPDMPALVMEFNILLLAICIFLFCVAFIIILFGVFQTPEKKKNKFIFFWIFVAFQIGAWLMDILQSEPQGTPAIRVLFITFSFLFAYLIIFRKNHKTFHIVYYAFASSAVAVALLSYYNSEIERESLKTTAQELTRTNENVVEFMVYQVLFQSVQNENVRSMILKHDDLSPTAFEIWLNSLLYRESVRSTIKFFDPGKNYVGGFQTTDDFPTGLYGNDLHAVRDSIITFKKANLFGDEITLTGISPIKNDNQIIGYVVVSAIYDEDYFHFSYLPSFLVAPKAGISSSLDFEKLKIFDFHDGEFVRYYGDVSLSNEEQKEILNADYGKNDEAWIKMDINGEENLVYALKIITPLKQKVLAVALESKTYSWNLSNFFKIFFVHTLIVLLFIFVYFMFRFKSLFEYLSTYRTRLIVAFLIISVIPLFSIAIYFRDLTEEKNSDLMEKRLDEMTRQVEAYLNIYANESTLNLNSICEKAANDLGINFSVYYEEKLIFSPEQNYVDAGLLPTTLNAAAFKDCFLSKSQKLFSVETFEGQNINSDYSKFQLAGQSYIINVNDLFNKISIPISDIELDFFLFGIFSLAVILLIMLSTFLAEQISAPIRKLTLATRAVGTGDFSVEVENKTRGEIRELVDGFNQMVKRIKQSQADIARLERETAWKEMAKQVAHEIKNPLTPMKLSIQQLIAAYKDKSPKLDAIFEKVTSTIISQIEILKNIASEFSNFARMPRINISKFDIITAIQESINLFGNEKISIRFTDPGKPVIINADEDQLKRTVINMIRNSIQANAAEINIYLALNEKFCELKISDDGAGIPRELIEKVFDENFTTKKSGMGLGLSMAKKYIESIDGIISIEESGSGGTIFLIKIPTAE